MGEIISLMKGHCGAECISVFGIAAAIILVYIIYRNSKQRDNKTFYKVLVWSTIVVVMASFVFDMFVLNSISKDNSFFSNVIIALSHSLEQFVFQTHFFDNGYQEYFFGQPSNGVEGHPAMLSIFVVLFLLSCVIVGSFLIAAILRRHMGLSSITSGNNLPFHVFFGRSERAVKLAQDIRSNHKGLCILIDDSYENDRYLGLSLLEKIKLMFYGFKITDKGDFDVVLYPRMNLSNILEDDDFFKTVDLKGLKNILINNKNYVYLLADDENINIHGANLLSKNGCSARIYCMARGESVNGAYENAMSARAGSLVTMIDSSSLAVNELRTRGELQPVNFVEQGKDDYGHIQGWTASSFDALIVGFGEMGQDVLGYLFEYAAFVGKDFKRSPFSCKIVDMHMDNLEGRYCASHPGLSNYAGVNYYKMNVGSEDFWTMVSADILKLKYIVVCLGDDKLSLDVGLRLLDLFNRQSESDNDKLVILVSQKSRNQLSLNTIDSYQSQSRCRIYPFGNEADVWKYDNITGKSIENAASRFYSEYKKAEGDVIEGDDVWGNREKKILVTSSHTELCSLLRKRSQDYANCYHMYTKWMFMDEYLRIHREMIADEIPERPTEDGLHYTGREDFVRINLEYLAVLEHIRWEASHTAMGYSSGPRTDAIRKTHKCIKDYADLPALTQHYDYLVVKTTLLIYGEKQK